MNRPILRTDPQVEREGVKVAPFALANVSKSGLYTGQCDKNKQLVGEFWHKTPNPTILFENQKPDFAKRDMKGYIQGLTEWQYTRYSVDVTFPID